MNEYPPPPIIAQVTSLKRIRIDFDCAALLCWLRDCNRYTLQEVAVKFEAPVKVRLLQKLFANDTNPIHSKFCGVISTLLMESIQLQP